MLLEVSSEEILNEEWSKILSKLSRVSKLSKVSKELSEKVKVKVSKKIGRKLSAPDITATHMTCNKCLVDKDMSEFNVDRSKRCGHQYTCRECSNRIVAKHTADNHDSYIMRQREWYAKNGKKYWNSYYYKHRDNIMYIQKKCMAMKKLRKMIEDGKYTMPETCSSCKSHIVNGNKLYAIFDNFKNVGSVRWLCRKCKKIELK